MYSHHYHFTRTMYLTFSVYKDVARYLVRVESNLSSQELLARQDVMRLFYNYLPMSCIDENNRGAGLRQSITYSIPIHCDKCEMPLHMSVRDSGATNSTLLLQLYLIFTQSKSILS